MAGADNSDHPKASSIQNSVRPGRAKGGVPALLIAVVKVCILSLYSLFLAEAREATWVERAGGDRDPGVKKVALLTRVPAGLGIDRHV